MHPEATERKSRRAFSYRKSPRISLYSSIAVSVKHFLPTPLVVLNAMLVELGIWALLLLTVFGLKPGTNAAQ